MIGREGLVEDEAREDGSIGVLGRCPRDAYGAKYSVAKATLGC